MTQLQSGEAEPSFAERGMPFVKRAAETPHRLGRNAFSLLTRRRNNNNAPSEPTVDFRPQEQFIIPVRVLPQERILPDGTKIIDSVLRPTPEQPVAETSDISEVPSLVNTRGLGLDGTFPSLAEAADGKRGINDDVESQLGIITEVPKN